MVQYFLTSINRKKGFKILKFFYDKNEKFMALNQMKKKKTGNIGKMEYRPFFILSWKSQLLAVNLNNVNFLWRQ